MCSTPLASAQKMRSASVQIFFAMPTYLNSLEKIPKNESALLSGIRQCLCLSDASRNVFPEIGPERTGPTENRQPKCAEFFKGKDFEELLLLKEEILRGFRQPAPEGAGLRSSVPFIKNSFSSFSLRNFGPFFSRFGKTNSNGLFSALHCFFASSRFQTASFHLMHCMFNALL